MKKQQHKSRKNRTQRAAPCLIVFSGWIFFCFIFFRFFSVFLRVANMNFHNILDIAYSLERLTLCDIENILNIYAVNTMKNEKKNLKTTKKIKPEEKSNPRRV